MLIGAFTFHPDGLDNPLTDYLKGHFVVALIAGIFASARLTLLVLNVWKARRGLQGRLEGGVRHSGESVTSLNTLNNCLTEKVGEVR